MARGTHRLWPARVAAGGLAALLGLSPGTADAQAVQKPATARPTTPPTAAPTRPTTPPAARPTTPPAARPTTPPAARPTSPPPIRPTTTPAPRPATPSPRPPVRPPADAGPPPMLPDVGPPPSLPSTDPAPTPDVAPTPTRPTPTPVTPSRPTQTTPAPQKPPQRPSSPPPVIPSTPGAPPPAYTPAPDPMTAPVGVPDAPPPVVPEDPLEPAPSTRPGPAGDPALRAPSIDGNDPLAGNAPAAKPTLEDLEALEKERARQERKTPKRWRHAGVVFELQVGTGGCTRSICRSDAGHHAAPGAHLGGFFGGNVFGVLELGIEAGWNTLRPRDVEMKNAVSLYGLDPERLEQEIAAQQGVPGLEVDFSSLVVTGAKSRFVNVGPTLRIHVLRKGRGIAYVGTGVHYQLWRNRYTTAGGDLRLDFHGLSIPLRVAGGAFVHPNISIVGEFSYAFSYFFLGGVNHPQVSAVAPISIVESTVVDAGASLKKGLPQFWNFTANLRFRF